ncbi:MAG: PqqD family protein [Dysgonamonadaceae bacterium]|jgi:hypothetical protein|nr:PqqD family protein [Dysgonamonadaceae bacterium]
MRIKENLVLRRIGSEYIVIVPDEGQVDLTEVYTLNETSVWIWEQLKDEDFTVEQVTELLLQRYDVDKESAMNDVLELIDIFRKGGLITEN